MSIKGMSTKGSILKCGMGLLAIGAMLGTVHAQDAEEASGGLEEVIVTATYRAQNIQDVPISITALSAQQLDAAGIFDGTPIAMKKMTIPNNTAQAQYHSMATCLP